MKYELAKQLKDAGFIQKGSVYGSVVGIPQPFTEPQEPYMPTLSELIEACGYCLSHIKQLHGTWWAVSHCGHEEHQWGGTNNLEECGGTPEEAVAKLWLALNAK